MVDGDRLAIETINLTKVFTDFWRREKVRALDNVNLRIYPGEVFGLLGPNGSGKSTAVKLMLGLLYPTSGSVAVLSHHPRNLRVKNRIGYMPEESYLYRFLNAEETLDFYGRLFNLHPRARRNRIARLLDMVGLTPHRRRPLSEYSKGMARRIGLAQALINDPEVMVLDEPTTGMDPIGTREIKDLILELKKRGKTVLLCSHLLADVEDVCDRIAVLYGGQVRTEGAVEDLLTQRSVTQITSEGLTEAAVAAVQRTLSELGVDNVNVSMPQERLEAYFLRVIEEARKRQPVTSGASVGTAASKFWEAADIEEEPKDLLEKLVTPTEAPAPQEAPRQAASSDEGVIPSGQEEKEPKEGVVQKLLSGPESEPQGAHEPVPKSRHEIAEEERRKRAQAVLDQLSRKANESGEDTADNTDEDSREDQDA